MSDRRLLVLTTSYPLREGSSAGVFVQRLLENLPDIWSVEVVCPQDNLPAAPRSTDRLLVIPVRYAPTRWQVMAQLPGGALPALSGRPWRMLLLPPLILALTWQSLKRARTADLIHANWTVCGLIAGIIGKILGKPVVTTLRGDDVTRAGDARLASCLLYGVVKLSTRIACVSAAMADSLRQKFPKDAPRIHVCLNGVDAAFLASGRGEVQNNQVLQLISVGSLVRRKGFDVLLRAIAKLHSPRSLHLRIAGDGPERQSLLDLAASLGIAGQVTLVGGLPPDEIPRLLASADVFVMSSHAEGRPNAVIEAVASGLPVISSCLPGVEGLVNDGENGWLFEIGSESDLVRVLGEVLADPQELLRRGRRAREVARGTIPDWKDAARAHARVFEEALMAVASRH